MTESWWGSAPTVGVALGAAAATVNNVPLFVGDVGTARAERGGWSQAAEFASLILDSGWVWAGVAVLAGWLISAGRRPAAGAIAGALGGAVALLCATVVYDSAEALFQGGEWSFADVRRYWLAASVVLGPVLGAVGAAVRRPGPAGLVAALVVPAGAAVQMVVLPPPADSAMAGPVTVTVWAAAATAAVVTVLRRTA